MKSNLRDASWCIMTSLCPCLCCDIHVRHLLILLYIHVSTGYINRGGDHYIKRYIDIRVIVTSILFFPRRMGFILQGSPCLLFFSPVRGEVKDTKHKKTRRIAFFGVSLRFTAFTMWQSMVWITTSAYRRCFLIVIDHELVHYMLCFCNTQFVDTSNLHCHY